MTPWFDGYIRPDLVGLRDEILKINGTDMSDLAGGKHFITRGDIAAAIATWQKGTEKTDIWREEMISKMANLLTIRQNYFCIVLVTQLVENVPEVSVSLPELIEASSPGQNGDYVHEGYYRVVCEKKMRVIVYRDAVTNSFNIVRTEYLEE